jgi:hypothetical protein
MAAKWWIVSQNNEPVLCLSEEGEVLTLAGKSIHLPEAYTKTRRIMPLVWEVLGDRIGD